MYRGMLATLTAQPWEQSETEHQLRLTQPEVLENLKRIAHGTHALDELKTQERLVQDTQERSLRFIMPKYSQPAGDANGIPEEKRENPLVHALRGRTADETKGIGHDTAENEAVKRNTRAVFQKLVDQYQTLAIKKDRTTRETQQLTELGTYLKNQVVKAKTVKATQAGAIVNELNTRVLVDDEKNADVVKGAIRGAGVSELTVIVATTAALAIKANKSSEETRTDVYNAIEPAIGAPEAARIANLVKTAVETGTQQDKIRAAVITSQRADYASCGREYLDCIITRLEQRKSLVIGAGESQAVRSSFDHNSTITVAGPKDFQVIFSNAEFLGAQGANIPSQECGVDNGNLRAGLIDADHRTLYKFLYQQQCSSVADAVIAQEEKAFRSLQETELTTVFQPAYQHNALQTKFEPPLTTLKTAVQLIFSTYHRYIAGENFQGGEENQLRNALTVLHVPVPEIEAIVTNMPRTSSRKDKVYAALSKALNNTITTADGAIRAVNTTDLPLLEMEKERALVEIRTLQVKLGLNSPQPDREVYTDPAARAAAKTKGDTALAAFSPTLADKAHKTAMARIEEGIEQHQTAVLDAFKTEMQKQKPALERRLTDLELSAPGWQDDDDQVRRRMKAINEWMTDVRADTAKTIKKSAADRFLAAREQTKTMPEKIISEEEQISPIRQIIRIREHATLTPEQKRDQVNAVLANPENATDFYCKEIIRILGVDQIANITALDHKDVKPFIEQPTLQDKLLIERQYELLVSDEAKKLGLTAPRSNKPERVKLKQDSTFDKGATKFTCVRGTQTPDGKPAATDEDKSVQTFSLVLQAKGNNWILETEQNLFDRCLRDLNRYHALSLQEYNGKFIPPRIEGPRGLTRFGGDIKQERKVQLMLHALCEAKGFKDHFTYDTSKGEILQKEHEFVKKWRAAAVKDMKETAKKGLLAIAQSPQEKSEMETAIRQFDSKSPGSGRGP